MDTPTVSTVRRARQPRIPKQDLFGATLHCTKCGVERSVKRFTNSKHKNGRRYYASVCMDCNAVYRKEWWTVQTPEYKRKLADRGNHQARVKKGARSSDLIKGAKVRSRQKNKPITIDRQFILDRLEQGYCSATGFRFYIGYVERGQSHSPFSPSVDCIVPQDGYTVENTQVVCTMYNVGKGAHPEIDFKAMCMAVALRNMADSAVHARMLELINAPATG